MAHAFENRSKDFSSTSVAVKSDVFSSCQYGDPKEVMTTRNKLQPVFSCTSGLLTIELMFSIKSRQAMFRKVPGELRQL